MGVMPCESVDCCQKCGPIREKFDQLYENKEEYRDLIYFTDIKKGDICVNLIHYDKNLKNEENMNYYRYFSDKVIGSYCPFDDFDMLKLFISKIKQIPFTPSYILMTSGEKADEIYKEFNNNDCINCFLIFCFEKNRYIYLKSKYKKLELITDDFSDVIKFLRNKKHSKEDLNMDNHLLTTPLITYYEYKKGIFPIHRVIAYFFDEGYDGFPPENLRIAKEFLMETIIETEIKQKLIKILENLSHSYNFPEDCIKYYTGENLCYVFNKALRNFEKYYVEMAHFIGPFYFGIFEYALKNEKKQLKEKTTLYRDVTMDRLDLYSYQFSEKDIICFPSFTSTTLKKGLNFEPSDNANKINNDQIEEKGYVKMIIKYEPHGKCIPQGLDVSNESEFSEEKEILLFPFTFLRIDKVEVNTGKIDDKHKIFLTIINKGDILEYGLKENYAFKLVENGTKIVLDEEHQTAYDKNESDYKMELEYIEKEYL
jgi:hypothetical protein